MCQDFQTYVPARLAEMGAALRDRDAPRFAMPRRAVSLLFAFSTAAGDVASDVEDHAAQGRLEEARPLVGQLEAMARELLGLADGLSLETLRRAGGGCRRPRTDGRVLTQEAENTKRFGSARESLKASPPGAAALIFLQSRDVPRYRLIELP